MSTWRKRTRWQTGQYRHQFKWSPTCWANSRSLQSPYKESFRPTTPSYSNGKKTSLLQKWYEKTTVPGLNFLPNRQADIQLRRLRFWFFSKQNGANTGHNTICPHCQQDFTPIHHLINCPAHTTCRQRLKDQLIPQQHSWTDHDVAALLIRKATIIPDIILPLLKKDPYIFH